MTSSRARREEKDVLHHAAHAGLCRSCADARGPRACAAWRVRVRDASECLWRDEVQRLRHACASGICPTLYELADARCQDLAAKNSPRWIVRPSDEAVLARWTRANRSHLCLARRERRPLPPSPRRTFQRRHALAQVLALMGSSGVIRAPAPSQHELLSFVRGTPSCSSREQPVTGPSQRIFSSAHPACSCLAHIGAAPPFRGSLSDRGGVSGHSALAGPAYARCTSPILPAPGSGARLCQAWRKRT